MVGTSHGPTQTHCGFLANRGVNGNVNSRSFERPLQVVYQCGAHLLEGRLKVIYQ